MTVTLPPELEVMVRQRVETGRYGDAGAVIREALRVLEAYERIEALRASLIEGNEQIERGQGVVWTSELMDRLARDARDLALQGRLPHPDVCP